MCVYMYMQSFPLRTWECLGITQFVHDLLVNGAAAAAILATSTRTGESVSMEAHCSHVEFQQERNLAGASAIAKSRFLPAIYVHSC